MTEFQNLLKKVLFLVEHTNYFNRSKRIGKQLMWSYGLRPGEVRPLGPEGRYFPFNS